MSYCTRKFTRIPPETANIRNHTQQELGSCRAGCPRGSGSEARHSLDSNYPKDLFANPSSFKKKKKSAHPNLN